LTVAIALAFGSGWVFAQSTGAGTASTTQSTSKSSAHEKLSHGDRKFIEDAAKGGMFEVQSGQLAQQKASDPAVKEFANRLVQDHTKANDELKQIAQAKGVQMPDKEKWGERREIGKLDKLSGAAFDHEFAMRSVSDHQKDIQEFEKAASKVKDPDVKAWAEKQLPVLREHLAMAQKLPEAGNQQSAANAPNTKAAGNRGAKY
jgi:putative membrane protein